jgi:hypothetical protein
MADDGNQIADDLDLDWSQLFPQMQRILGEVATTSSGQLFAALEYTPSDDVFAEVAESTANYAALRAAELIGKKWVNGELVDNPDPVWAISETTRNSLYSLINQALEEGWSASKIRDEVAASYQFSQARALMIARTERQLAQSRGALAAAKASGVVRAKRSVLSDGPSQPRDAAQALLSSGSQDALL